MKCQEATELMSDAVEGTAGIAFDCHLAACPSCSLYLSQFRVTIELTARLRDLAKPAEGFHRQLLHRANNR